MLIYIIMGEDWDDREILGVESIEEMAIEKRRELMADNCIYPEINIEVWEVGGAEALKVF